MKLASALLLIPFLITGCLTGSPSAVPDDAEPRSTLDTTMDAPAGARAAQLLRDFAMGHPWRHSDHPTELAAARTYLRNQVNAAGLELLEHNYRATGNNILALDRGVTHPDSWIIFSCHYDTQPNTIYGARDDGLGCAAMLEMMKTFSTREWNHTIAYAFFDEEEKGLIGAVAFVKDYTQNATVELVANINLDPAGLHYPCGDPNGPYAVNVILSLDKVAGPKAVPGYAELLRAVRSGLNASKVPPNLVHIATKQTYSYVTVQDRHYQVPGADYEAFDRVDIPSVWLGAPPLDVVGPAKLWGYPNHTPLDTAELVEARCGSRELLGRGLQVALDTSRVALELIDSVLPAADNANR